ncbi:MAG: flagellar hook assembly protein FlgD [Candidatus Cloacimonetes bacterium]|nr:flagellar hook assembly protein FlgD [Candidatus Cloacimonadota bacterium]
MFYPISGTSHINYLGDLPINSSISKDEFLKMLIAQLQNQNPLNPQTSAEFISQLTQFTSVEQLSNINRNLLSALKSNLELINSLNNTSALDLIGKDVKIHNDMLIIESDTTQVSFNYFLDSNAENVIITINNEYNEVIKTIELTDEFLNKGDHYNVIWDGTDNNGNRVSVGNYTVDILAIDAYRKLINTFPFIEGTVTGIRFSEEGIPKLIVNDNEYDLIRILEVLHK